MSKTLLLWLEGARPKTWIATLSPVAIGTLIAWSESAFNPLIALLTLCSALFIQVGTNFSNDYLDALKGGDTSDRVGPRRLAQTGLVSISALKKATFASFGSAALFAVYLTWIGGVKIALLAALSISCGFLYTAGPYSLAYLGLGDLFVFLFFGPIATAGTAYLQLGTLSFPALIAGLAPGALSTALLTANNLRDQKSDQRAGKKTIAVRFGPPIARLEYLLCLIIAALIPIALAIITTNHRAVCLTTTFLLFAKKPLTLLFCARTPKELSKLLPQTAKLLTLYTLLFLVTWLLPL